MSNNELCQTVLSTTDQIEPAHEFGWGKLNSDKAARGLGFFDTSLTLGECMFVADTQGHHSNFYNDIGGNAGLDKRRAGTLAAPGDNSYTGESTVNDGTLAVYGTQLSWLL